MTGEAQTVVTTLAVAARTDKGYCRALNEDALFAADPCFVIADGMGGHERGDAASKAAISAFSEAFTAPGEASIARVEQAIAEARQRVQAVAAQTSRGAGCTLSGAIRVTHEGIPHWYVLNIGDSRVYLQRGSELRQLTVDHSLRSELLSEGNVEGARTPRNIITRALGSDDDRHDAWMLPIETGSRLLVCSDGLTIELEDAEISELLAYESNIEVATSALVSRALEAGGRDNISIILVDVCAGGVAMPIPEDDTYETLQITRPRTR